MLAYIVVNILVQIKPAEHLHSLQRLNWPKMLQEPMETVFAALRFCQRANAPQLWREIYLKNFSILLLEI